MDKDGKTMYEDADFAPSTPEDMSTLYRSQDIVSDEEAL